MKLNAAKVLRDDLDELLDAVRELKHELGSDNEKVKPSGKRNYKKSRGNGVGYYKKGQANNHRDY